MMFAAGTLLGTYEITGLLGAGGMGEVYRGRDTRLDRPVALKVLPAALAADPRFRQRFDREARVISRLNHPQICTVYDIGDAQGVSFLVMELVEGETLRAWAKPANGPGRSPTSWRSSFRSRARSRLPTPPGSSIATSNRTTSSSGPTGR